LRRGHQRAALANEGCQHAVLARRGRIVEPERGRETRRPRPDRKATEYAATATRRQDKASLSRPRRPDTYINRGCPPASHVRNAARGTCGDQVGIPLSRSPRTEHPAQARDSAELTSCPIQPRPPRRHAVRGVRGRARVHLGLPGRALLRFGRGDGHHPHPGVPALRSSDGDRGTVSGLDSRNTRAVEGTRGSARNRPQDGRR
jgi:hypothetical protein